MTKSLKLLEEPPAKTVLILVSHRPRRLLPTIISRCYKIHLCIPDKEQALVWLNNSNVKQAELALAQAGGAPVIASTLDQENYWKNRNIVLDALADKSSDPVALVEQIQSYDLPMVLSWLQKWTYDMIFFKCSRLGWLSLRLSARVAIR